MRGSHGLSVRRAQRTSQEARLEVGARKASILLEIIMIIKRYLARASSGEKEPLRPLLGQEAWAASGQKFTWFRCAILDQFLLGDFFYKYQVRSGRTYGKR